MNCSESENGGILLHFMVWSNSSAKSSYEEGQVVMNFMSLTFNNLLNLANFENGEVNTDSNISAGLMT